MSNRELIYSPIEQFAPEVIPLPREKSALAAAVLMRAFHDDPMFTYILPDASTRPDKLLRFFGAGIQYGLLFGEVYTTPKFEGVAIWMKPGYTDVTFMRMLRSGMISLPVNLGFGAFQRFMKMVDYTDKLHLQTITGGHWVLLSLGVDPDEQQRGIGSALIQPVLAKADSMGQACYLETEKEVNVRFYQRHGFHVAAEGQVPDSHLNVIAMLREAPIARAK